jgi:predicted phage terminase large subunit-like protein
MIQTTKTQLSRINRDLGKDFAFFRKFYFEHYHRFPDSAFHKEAVVLLKDITLKRGQKLAIAAPRASAKSTLITLEYVLYSICYRLDPFIVIFSSTTDQSERYLNDIKRELESNPKLIADFPEICEFGKKPGPPRWCKREILTKNGVNVITMSPGKQARGMRNREARPSLIILDDAETDEKIQSAEQYDKIHDWFTKTVLKLGSAETNIIMTGTIHHYNSLLAQYVSEKANPDWIKKVYRSVMSETVNPKLWEKWARIYHYHEEFNGEEGPAAAAEYFEANREAMLENTQVLWPEYKNYYELMKMREEGGHASFDSEMQNNPINPADCDFNLDTAYYWDDRFSSVQELLSALEGHVEIYGACDPSMGKSQRRGDYSAIVMIARDTDTGTMYVILADIECRKPDATIDAVLAHYQSLKCSRFAFETNQFQEFMKDELEKRGRARGIYPTIEDVKHTSDKVLRIQSLQPLVKNGSIQFSRKHRTLLEQLKYFPRAPHDDGPDALEMAAQLAKNGSGYVLHYYDEEKGCMVSI